MKTNWEDDEYYYNKFILRGSVFDPVICTVEEEKIVVTLWNLSVVLGAGPLTD